LVTRNLEIPFLYSIFSSITLPNSMDWVPAVSQAKSLVQTVSGDIEGAKQTQRNFIETFPIVSQVKSLGHFLKGNREKAKKVQKNFITNAGGFTNEAINSTPVIGHIKGAVHYAMGDREGGKQAIDSASHASGAIIGGTGGFLAGGPIGAFVGGVIGANAVDLVLTGAESAIKGEFKPHGHVEAISNLANGNTESKSGDTFDLAMSFILDGLIGQVGGAQKHAQIHKGHLTNYQPGTLVQNVTKIEEIRLVNPENIENSTSKLNGLRGLSNDEKLPFNEKASSPGPGQRSTQVPESPYSYETESLSQGEIDKILIEPDQIKFSQPPLEGYSPQAQIIIYQLTEDMSQNGWAGEPINIVRMLSGELIAFDSRKLFCAIQAGIEAPLHLRDYHELLPVSVRLSFEDENIKTWGQAIDFYIQNHSENIVDLG